MGLFNEAVCKLLYNALQDNFNTFQIRVEYWSDT